MRNELTLAHQTTYAELLSQSASDAFHAAFAEEGFFTAKQPTPGKRYWYFELPGGKQRYVGPETPELLDRIDRHRQVRSRDRDRRALVSTLVRSANLPRPPRAIGAVIEALAKAGVFRLRGVLVGTVAYQTYSAMLATRLPQALLQTGDVDIAQYHEISVAVEDETPPILDVLRAVDPTFRPIPHIRDGRRITKYRADDGVSVDFLTPNEGADTDEPRRLPALRTDAEPLRFLGFLIREPEPAVVLYDAGVYVWVPSPQRFAIHKLIVAQRRKLGSGKREKDLKQSETLLNVLAEKRSDHLHEAWKEAVEPAQSDLPARGWRSHLRKGLSLIDPIVRDKTLKAIGERRSFVDGLDLEFDASPARYDVERDVVVFWGKAADRRIRCFISREALEDHFKADGLDQKGRVDVFNRNRSRIEAMARAKYLFQPIEEFETLLIRTNEVEHLSAEGKPTRRDSRVSQ